MSCLCYLLSVSLLSGTPIYQRVFRYHEVSLDFPGWLAPAILPYVDRVDPLIDQ